MIKRNELSIKESARALRSGEITVRELWDACFEEANNRNSELKAYLELFATEDEAIMSAQRRIDKEGDMAPLLCGIPVALKDNILIEGKIASAASKMLGNYIATYDATVTEKLKDAGALFLGRTNMDEFAMGSSTEHSAYGATKNPHDTNRVPGGSSGGSATAVSAHMAIASIGTDTGGSIRQPAAHTGLVGLKPTYGAVSRHGLIAMGSSLDQAGPLTKTVEDAEIIFKTIRGNDPLDSTTLPSDVYKEEEPPEKLRIGVPRDLLDKGVDSDLLNVFNKTLKALVAEGNTIVDVELPSSKFALPAYYVIMPAEVSSNLSRFDGIRYGLASRGKTLLDDYLLSRSEGFGTETRRRILLGTFVLSAGYIDDYYHKAQATRSLLRSEYQKVFKEVDVIAFPTTPSPAFRFGEKSDSVSMYLEDVFTVTANLTGMPALSVPMGSVDRDGSNLPVGMHFTAPHKKESLLFSVGKDVEVVRSVGN